MKRGRSAPPVFLTRLHVRYDAEHFPEDLIFQETGDTQNFQARYVLQHPWQGDKSCAAAVSYKQNLSERQEIEAQRLAKLTAWDINDIRREMSISEPKEEKPWYERIWG